MAFWKKNACATLKKNAWCKKGCICEKIAYLFPFQNGIPVKISLGVTQVRVHTAKWWILLLTNYSSKKNWRQGTNIFIGSHPKRPHLFLPANKHYDGCSKMLLCIWNNLALPEKLFKNFQFSKSARSHCKYI